MQPGDEGVPIGEAHLLDDPSPSQVFGFNRDGRRDASNSKSSSSSSASLAAAAAKVLGPQKEVSSCIRCGDGERRPEKADRNDMPDVADTLDEMEDSLVSRHGNTEGSVACWLFLVPMDPLRSSGLPGGASATLLDACPPLLPTDPGADLPPVARSDEFLESLPLMESVEYGMPIPSAPDDRRSTSAAPSRKADVTLSAAMSRPKSSLSGVESPLSPCDELLACSTSILGVVGVCAVEVEAETSLILSVCW
jgi:hypothetical protein